jgi:hypothetical protein
VQPSARVADYAFIPLVVLRFIILHPPLHAKAGIRAAIEKGTHGRCP